MTPQTYQEQDFEEYIEEYLLKSGYNKRTSESFNKDSCLIPDEVIQFIQSSQPKEYEKLQKQYGADTPNKLCYRLAKEISQKGTLQILRKGIKDRGAKFSLAYYKPSSGMNPEHQNLYKQNRFSIVRQLKYSKKNEKSIDISIFLNGLPIITAELKNSLTGQFVEDAVKQYKEDRDPKEPLFQFKRCLVHFAVGNEKVFMTTKLQGDKTRFLPFNKDTENPINLKGHKTAYLWEDIFQPDTLLNFINNYLHIQKTSEKFYDKTDGLVERVYENFIFPRFHQLDCVRKILDAVRKDVVGHSYLVQHSAGSGKSNSIAWLAHQLASFYQKDTDKERLFDSIIVVTDRKVLDKQLQDTIKQFEKTAGVVKKIEINSAQLKEALEHGKDIIVTTLQKFPIISENMTELKGQKFAVIIDEAHSSQSGESSKHLKKTLSANFEEDKEEKDDFDLEDKIINEIRSRGRQSHISYFAFTATPKNKTLELFGNKTTDGKFVAFHNYTMRQAIEEGFILDVLKNYITFKRYFKLAKKIEIVEDEEYEKKKAIRLLTSYVDLQPHAVEMKTRLVLDHFLEKTVNAIQGRGRAMFATGSRLLAVKYYLMFKKIMGEKHLTYKPLVAFSGTVKDPDSLEEYTEKSLNGLQSKISIPDAFKTPEYRILIVANKYQTGFDEPFLHTMYVDKKLRDVQAVQALSRLNRKPKGKNETFILDFVNEADDIKQSFQPYYQTTFLEEETDPNKLYSHQSELGQFEIYTNEDIKEFAKIFFNPKEQLEKLQPILDRAVNNWTFKQENEREDFRGLLQSFIRLYGFISQIITFQDIELEELYVFAKNLNRKLPKRDNRLPYEIRDSVDLDSFRIQRTYQGNLGLEAEDSDISSITGGATQFTFDEKVFLTNIIKTLNETFGIDLTDEDKVDIERIKMKLEEDEGLHAVMKGNNTVENKRYKFNQVLDAILLHFVHNKLDLYKKLSEPKVNAFFKQKWFDGYNKRFNYGL